MENATSSTPRATGCYAVRVLRQILAADGREQIERYVELPFVPMVGLKLGFESYDDHIEVEEVAFIVAFQRFEIVGESYEDLNDSLQEIVASFKQDGWNVSA